MDFLAPKTKEPLSTPPKLLLFSLHSKHPTLPDGLTPPPFTTAAVPFLWEEAPGKPRLAKVDDPPKSKIVRSLGLPPRLVTTAPSPINNGKDSNRIVSNGGIETIPSPTTVLGGPYEATYVSIPFVRSQEKVVASSNNSTKTKVKARMPLKKLMRKEKSAGKFSSWRWDSFRDTDGGKGVRSKSLKFCSWRWDSFRDSGRGGNVGSGGSICSSVNDDLKSSFDSGGKNGKVTRRSSFTFGNGTTSGFLASMYGTLKQAIPWRSR